MENSWKNLNDALNNYGYDISYDMKKNISKQKHIDTGRLKKSITTHTTLTDNRHFLYVDFLEYGKFAERWFKKGTKKLDLPTFYQDWFNNNQLNKIVGDSATIDLEITIKDFVDNYNKK
jgi:hypothetical protein